MTVKRNYMRYFHKEIKDIHKQYELFSSVHNCIPYIRPLCNNDANKYLYSAL